MKKKKKEFNYFSDWHNYITGGRDINDIFVDCQVNKKGENEMNEKNKPTQIELEEAAKPLLELLNKYYNPHATVIVTQGFARVVVDDIGVRLPVID